MVGPPRTKIALLRLVPLLLLVVGAVFQARKWLIHVETDEWLSYGFDGMRVPMGDGNYGLELLDEANTTQEYADVFHVEGISGPPPLTRKATLYKPVVYKESKDLCAQPLQIPKIAMLFLSKGTLHHTRVWQAWFASAGRYIPVEYCRSPLPETCRVKFEQNIDFEDPLDQQCLFSVYLHVPPGAEEQLEDMWRKRLISRRIQPKWGTHELVEATRELIWEAFTDPLNQRFVLLSESDIPMYSPLVFYRQIMSEEKSRVNTNGYYPTDTYRWHWRFLLSNPPVRNVDWRKSGQFFSLIREHAEVILNDVAVFRIFERNCIDHWDSTYSYWRVCYSGMLFFAQMHIYINYLNLKLHPPMPSDEHYIPTLLYMKNESERTNANPDGIVSVDWSRGGEHPKEYNAHDMLEPGFWDKLRNHTSTCCCTVKRDQQMAKAAEAESTFLHASKVSTSGMCALPALTYTPFWRKCPLTARKFKVETTMAVRKAFFDCNSTLKLLHPQVCTSAYEYFHTKDKHGLLSQLSEMH